MREFLLDLAADHHGDDLVERRFGEVVRGDIAPVAEDRNAIGDFLELVEPVRDINDGATVVAQNNCRII